MNKVNAFVIGTIIVGTLVNIASTILAEEFPLVSVFLTIALVILVSLWLLVVLIRWAYRALSDAYAAAGRSAVLVYFVEREQRFLLVMHPHHKRRIPPGGRLHNWEMPHEAVARTLKDEAGIDSDEFEFHPAFHDSGEPLSDTVETVPSPYFVQLEGRRQRNFVPRHHAFVYVCRFRSEDRLLRDVEGYDPRWFTRDDLKALPVSTRPFDDVHLVLDRICRRIGEVADAP